MMSMKAPTGDVTYRRRDMRVRHHGLDQHMVRLTELNVSMYAMLMAVSALVSVRHQSRSLCILGVAYMKYRVPVKRLSDPLVIEAA